MPAVGSVGMPGSGAGGASSAGGSACGGGVGLSSGPWPAARRSASRSSGVTIFGGSAGCAGPRAPRTDRSRPRAPAPPAPTPRSRRTGGRSAAGAPPCVFRPSGPRGRSGGVSRPCVVLLFLGFLLQPVHLRLELDVGDDAAAMVEHADEAQRRQRGEPPRGGEADDLDLRRVDRCEVDRVRQLERLRLGLLLLFVHVALSLLDDRRFGGRPPNNPL